MLLEPIPDHELRGALSQAHSDLFKDINGVRPRHLDYRSMPIEELERRVLDLQAEARELADQWAKEDADLVALWEEQDMREDSAEADNDAAGHWRRPDYLTKGEDRYLDFAADHGFEGY